MDPIGKTLVRKDHHVDDVADDAIGHEDRENAAIHHEIHEIRHAGTENIPRIIARNKPRRKCLLCHIAQQLWSAGI